MFKKKPDVQQKTIDFVNSFANDKNIELLAQKVLKILPESNDPSIDVVSIEDEVRCMSLELFATACAVKNINSAIEQSVFMKKYLHERFLGDSWENMKPYNDAVSKSATNGLDGTTPKGRFRLTYVDRIRLGMADKYIEENGKENADEAVGRAINRFGVIPSKMSEYMAMALCEELGISPKNLEPLTEFILKLYKLVFKFVKK